MLISKMVFNESAAFKNIFFSPYGVHQAVWSLFSDSPDRERDFLYRLDTVGKMPVVYAVSRREPQDSKGLWNINSKDYDPQIRNGMVLGFTVRVNPVRKIADKRHDIVMDAKYKARTSAQGQSDVLPLQEIVAQVCKRWIDERGKQHGFNTKQFRTDAYRQIKFCKVKGGKPVQYSTVDITGVLEVIEQKPFTEMLFSGLGPAKGFGCGLMLVRRI